jgi:hypothetical protein
MEATELRNAGLQRLKSGEFPEAVARDLKKQGLTYPELQSLFREAAVKKRRGGFIRIALGVAITLATALLVMGAMEAGFRCYGPGVAVGLFVIANGILQLKNAREMKKAVEVPQL